MPDVENSSEEGAELVPGKCRENSCKTGETIKTAVLGIFWLFSGCFAGTLPGFHSAPFSAVVRLCSTSGIRYLSRWPQRLQ